jgi:hypothetical protein
MLGGLGVQRPEQRHRGGCGERSPRALAEAECQRWDKPRGSANTERRDTEDDEADQEHPTRSEQVGQSGPEKQQRTEGQAIATADQCQPPRT